MTASARRLGFVTARSAYVDDTGIWTEAGVARLLEVWQADGWDLTVSMSRSPVRQPLHDQRLALDPARFVALPWLPSVIRGFHKAPLCHARIATVERRSDVVIVQLPFAATLGLVYPRRPRVYHLCHDVLGAVRSSTIYTGARRLPAVALAEGIDRLQRRLMWSAGARTVANGRELWEHYGRPPGRAVVSATISEREVLSVPRRRTGGRFRVLYVGFLRHEKGIDTLVDAFEEVLRELPDAELHLVCAAHTVDQGVGAEIQQRLERWTESGHAVFLGAKKFGPELFQCYADADVLAVPSRAEGTPRVIVEARALGCPVVATSVGGVPTSIRDGVDGLMVPPGAPGELARALVRVAREPGLRPRLVEAGLARARGETVESFARAITGEATMLVSEPLGREGRAHERAL
jgi:glycosyltransferase involved in cell wall biosynthesis